MIEVEYPLYDRVRRETERRLRAEGSAFDTALPKIEKAIVEALANSDGKLPLKIALHNVEIVREERKGKSPSDHAPVLVELD